MVGCDGSLPRCESLPCVRRTSVFCDTIYDGCCLVDDLPIVGPLSHFSNLYINTGHGFRGTNYGMPSGSLLVRSVLQRPEVRGLDAPEPVQVRDAELKCEMDLLSRAVSPARFGL